MSRGFCPGVYVRGVFVWGFFVLIPNLKFILSAINAALFSLILCVITLVWRDKTDAIHLVRIVLVIFVLAIVIST